MTDRFEEPPVKLNDYPQFLHVRHIDDIGWEAFVGSQDYPYFWNCDEGGVFGISGFFPTRDECVAKVIAQCERLAASLVDAAEKIRGL